MPTVSDPFHRDRKREQQRERREKGRRGKMQMAALYLCAALVAAKCLLGVAALVFTILSLIRPSSYEYLLIWLIAADICAGLLAGMTNIAARLLKKAAVLCVWLSPLFALVLLLPVIFSDPTNDTPSIMIIFCVLLLVYFTLPNYFAARGMLAGLKQRRQDGINNERK